MNVTERIPIDRLKALSTMPYEQFKLMSGISTEKKCKDQYKYLLKYVGFMEKADGVMTHHYASDTNQGRMFCGTSIQNKPKFIRGFLLHDITSDIDMVNAHPCILFHLCKQHNIPCLNLKNYIENRDEILENGLATKQDYLKCVNNDKKMKMDDPVFNAFDKEMKAIQKALLPHYPQFVTTKTYNPNGSKINHILCHFENKILQIMVQMILSKNIEICALMFDGLMIYGEPDAELLTELEAGIAEYGIRLSYKDHNVELVIAEGGEAQDSSQALFEAERIKFEEKVCKIVNKGFYARDDGDTVTILSKAILIACYEHIQVGFTDTGCPVNFIKRWANNNNSIRTKQDIGVYPRNCPDNIYNLWVPFSGERLPECVFDPSAIDLFEKHISIMCNHEYIVAQWVIDWIAQMIQFPDVKTTMPTFVSKPGAGKDSLLELLRKLLGHKKVFETTKPSLHIFGDFNSQMADAHLVVLSEVSAMELKNCGGQLKGLITDSKLTINTKGVSSYEIDCYARFMAFTNNEEAIKPEKEDRRNVVIRSSYELCKNGFDRTAEEIEVINAYVEKYRRLLDDKNAQKTIYEWLKSRPNLEEFHTRVPPKTEFHKTQTNLTITPIEQWVEAFTLLHHAKEEVKLSSQDCYTQFKEWCRINSKYDCTSIQFAVRLKNLNIKGITKGKRTKNGNTILFNIPLLKIKYDITDVADDSDEEETISEL